VKRALLLTIAVLAIVAASVAATLAAGRVMLPAGTIRIASQVDNNGYNVHGGCCTQIDWTDFSVPTGKVADIQATYHGQIVSNDAGAAAGLCFVGFRLDGGDNALAPGDMVVLDKSVDHGSGLYDEARSAAAMKNSIPPGNHEIQVMAHAGGNGCVYAQNLLFLTVNIHS
jgi:hypothetical protein